MLKRAALLISEAGLAVACLSAAEQHAARGLVLRTDIPHHTFVVSCEAIPGYMAAMEMDFTVREPKVLAGLRTGTAVNFTIVEHGKALYAEDVRAGATANYESEPMAAGQLSALEDMLAPAAQVLVAGQPVPDFALTDQAGRTIHLADFLGKTVAITFGYSRCPNPNYCFRLSQNFARLRDRFRDQAGREFVLLTIMIDPEHDQGATLARYADAWKADAADWHFLTGPLPEIKQVARQFGMNFWRVDGGVTHSLRTVIINSKGQLAVNLEGNEFTPQELGDVLQTVMKGS